MIWQVIITGLTVGLVSSLHCIGMCGPLALALPVYHLPKRQQVVAMILYNSGRFITYAAIGLVFGLAGRTFYLAGLQRWFSIGAGVVLLALVIQYYYFRSFPKPGWISSFYSLLQLRVTHFLKSPRSYSYVVVGMANGLLPCAMVYFAVAVSLSFAEVWQSVLLMGMFGAGTLPAMLLLGIFGVRVPVVLRKKLTKFVPVFFTTLAILLILRGFNLGIPFLSPSIDSAHAEAASCH
jgi:uncharacterized protein